MAGRVFAPISIETLEKKIEAYLPNGVGPNDFAKGVWGYN